MPRVAPRVTPRVTQVIRAPFLGERKLVLLAVWFVAIKVLATLALTSSRDSVYDISFGFGPFVESLLTTGDYQGCVDGVCTAATRMPGMPLFFAAVGLLSTNLLFAALVKTVVMSAAVVLGFRYLFRSQPGSLAVRSWVWFLAAGILAVSPPLIKHATTTHYEEGFLIEVLFLWTFAFLLACRRLADPDGRTDGHTDGGSGDGLFVMIVALGTLAYLFKSSMILVLGLSLLVALAGFVRGRNRAVLVAGLVSLGCVAGWGVHNAVATGHFSVMTSFDGQNAYRGANDQGAKIYPEIYLDRLFDSEVAHLPDGKAVELPPLKALGDFPDEWSQDAYYKEKATDWILANPGSAVAFGLKKATNFFVDVRKTPYTYESDARNLPTTAEDVVVTGWLGIGRLLEVLMVGLLVMVWRRGSRAGRAVCGAVVAANAAYAAPYLVGFNYERHVTTYLVLVAVCAAVLLVELRGTPATGPTKSTARPRRLSSGSPNGDR